MTCEPGRASYTIRPANPADLPALQALAAACDVCRPGAHDPLWLADEMSLLSLAVHPAARRQGIARALHHAALAALRPAVAFLEVRANNHAAQALYADLGYRVSGRRRAYYPNPDGSREDALVLRWQAAPTE